VARCAITASSTCRSSTPAAPRLRFRPRGRCCKSPVTDWRWRLTSRQPSSLSPSAGQLIDRSRSEDPVLARQKILVVDDDVRNIFAISAALETYGAHVNHAESGLAGIDTLLQHPDTDAVLMDVMMPTIDGLETLRRIRQLPQFGTLPISAVTAKAMPGDRETCLEAGASDYLAKPVDMDHLRAMLRVWLTA